MERAPKLLVDIPTDGDPGRRRRPDEQLVGSASPGPDAQSRAAARPGRAAPGRRRLAPSTERHRNVRIHGAHPARVRRQTPPGDLPDNPRHQATAVMGPGAGSKRHTPAHPRVGPLVGHNAQCLGEDHCPAQGRAKPSKLSPTTVLPPDVRTCPRPEGGGSPAGSRARTHRARVVYVRSKEAPARPISRCACGPSTAGLPSRSHTRRYRVTPSSDSGRVRLRAG